jgi:LPXTG-motif cell wall-anchored protein
VAADTGEQEWAFETGSTVSSSPTVVDGTVFVGSWDTDLHAVAAGTGEQEWAFETGGVIQSSPTVVDGTVFVGSNDGNLYAVDADVSGSSEGSRTRLGTLGHHGEWRYAEQSIDITPPDSETPDSDQSWVQNNAALIVGGVGSVAGGGYLIRRRRKSPEQSQEESSEPASEASASGTTESNDQSTTASEGPTADGESSSDSHRNTADKAIETAVTAKSNNNYDEAAEAYTEAITEYQSAFEALAAGATEQQKEISQVIESARSDLEAVTTRRDQRNDVTDSLQPAERSLQEAIVAFVEDDQTIARIRFRQARDTFAEAIEKLDNSDVDVLSQPIEVDVEPDRALSSTTFSELPSIPDAAASALSDSDIETIEDLANSEKPPWTPPEVDGLTNTEELSEETVAKLTVLSWWHDDESYEFNSAEAITHRQQQAEYGFEQAK